MAELGTAYILIEPSMKGSQTKITNELTGAGKIAGESASGSFGGSFLKGVGKVAKVGAKTFAVIGTAVVGTGIALVKGANEVAAYGDNIDKMSQKMGLTAQAYQEWDFVMQHSGTSMETMKSSMKTLATAAESGNEAFQALGMTQEQIATMSQEELFGATIAGLQNVSSETERTYLAGKLLGRGATELGALLNMSAEDTAAMKQQLHELGGVMSDEDVKASAAYMDSMQNMKTAMGGLTRGITSQFMPSITGVMDGLSMVFSGNTESGLGMINEGIGSFMTNLTNNLPQILEVGKGIVFGLLGAITENLPAIIQAGIELIIQLATGLIAAIPELVAMIPEIIMAIYNGIVEAGPELLAAGAQLLTWIGEGVMSLISMAVEWGQGVVDEMLAGLVAAWDALVAWVSTGMENIGSAIQSAWEVVTAPFIALWEEMSAFVSSTWETITSAVSSALDTISSTIDSVWNTISSTVSSILDGISSTVSSVWDSIVSAVSGAVESVQSAISDAFETAKSAVSGAVEAISQTVTDVFNGIKNFLAPVVDWLAGIFDFSWELPQLKMPHFTVTGKFSLNPPSIPTFSISWYAKAMSEPFLFSSPTIMGSASGLRGFGENGDEIVYGRDNLLRDIASVTNRPINLYIDGDKLVGSTLGSTDQQLGRVSELKARFVGV